MPVSKRRPHVSEILDVAVKQQRKVREATVEILERPAHIWTRKQQQQQVHPAAGGGVGTSQEPPNQLPNATTASHKGSLRWALKQTQLENAALLDGLSALAPAGLVQWSRLCEKLLESTAASYLRLLLSPIGFLVVAYSAPQLALGVDNDLDLAVYYLDYVVNVVYLVQSFVRVSGLVIRYKIERAFNREVDVGVLLRQSGLLALAVTALCFAYPLASEVGLWVRLLRLTFIAASILEFLPHIDVLMSGISYGVRSTLYTVLMLALLIMLYASICFQLFADNDPYHFGTYALSCLTLFQMSTFENWSVVWYVNYGGCDSFPSEYSGAAAGQDPVDSPFGTFELPYCAHPIAQPVAASLLFVTFAILGGYICVNMSLAAVAIGIHERLDELRNVELFGVDKRDENVLSHRIGAGVSGGGGGPAASSGRAGSSSIGGGHAGGVRRTRGLGGMGESSKAFKVTGDDGQRGRVKELGRLVACIWSPPPAKKKHPLNKPSASALALETATAANSSGNKGGGLYRRYRVLLRLYVCALLEGCRAVDNVKAVKGATAALVLFDALVTLVALSYSAEQQRRQEGVTQGLHIALESLLTGRLVIRLLACYSHVWSPVDTLKPKPTSKSPTATAAAGGGGSGTRGRAGRILDGWLLFDAASLALCWVPAVAPALPDTRFLQAMCILRLALVARFLSFISDLDVIIKAITSSLVTVAYVVFVMALFFYYFAAAGCLLFKRADPYHFGSFESALKTLLQVMTLDNWSDIMRTCMYGCAHHGYDTGLPKYDGLCQSGGGVGWWAAAFFVSFVIISAMVLVSLLIAVIITSMELLREESRESDDVWGRMEGIQTAYELSDDAVDALLTLFEKVDGNNNGHLTFQELGELFLAFHMPEETQFEFYMLVDRDGSGQIDFCEFCEMMTLIHIASLNAESSRKSSASVAVTSTVRPADIQKMVRPTGPEGAAESGEGEDDEFKAAKRRRLARKVSDSQCSQRSLLRHQRSQLSQSHFNQEVDHDDIGDDIEVGIEGGASAESRAHINNKSSVSYSHSSVVYSNHTSYDEEGARLPRELRGQLHFEGTSSQRKLVMVKVRTSFKAAAAKAASNAGAEDKHRPVVIPP